MSMPIGFKNATDGSIKPAADSCFAAAFEHHFLSINLDGRVISAETKGNPDCHLVLRGSSHGPNCDAASVAQALADLKASKASGPSEHGLIIDAAHGNCGKNEVREAEVVEEIAARRRGRRTGHSRHHDGKLPQGGQSEARAARPAGIRQVDHRRMRAVGSYRAAAAHALPTRSTRVASLADVSAPSLLSLGKEATRRARSCSSS